MVMLMVLSAAVAGWSMGMRTSSACPTLGAAVRTDWDTLNLAPWPTEPAASENPLDQLRLTLMQEVLPVGLAMVERARKGGPGQVLPRCSLQESADPHRRAASGGGARGSVDLSVISLMQVSPRSRQSGDAGQGFGARTRTPPRWISQELNAMTRCGPCRSAWRAS